MTKSNKPEAKKRPSVAIGILGVVWWTLVILIVATTQFNFGVFREDAPITPLAVLLFIGGLGIGYAFTDEKNGKNTIVNYLGAIVIAIGLVIPGIILTALLAWVVS